MDKRKVAVAKLAELQDGEMKEVAAGETKVLLARVGGKYYVVGAHCTHYGEPLVEDALPKTAPARYRRSHPQQRNKRSR
ncbi:MAG TPA: Rieske 2Fe-2S domain-containing protein [Blastocatellia bacterium]